MTAVAILALLSVLIESAGAAQSGAKAFPAGPSVISTDSMPSDFRFWLHFGVPTRGSDYNSQSGVFKVDRVCEPYDTLIVQLTPAELNTIWRTLADIKFFEYPGTLRIKAGPGELAWGSAPDTRMDLIVFAGGKEHEVSWDSGAGPYSEHDQQLGRLAGKIVRMLQSSLPYLALPRLPCGYY